MSTARNHCIVWQEWSDRYPPIIQQGATPMTDTTIPPLTEADVTALGFTPFGFERDDRMGAVLAHRDGEAYYMQRAAAFWSIDPEYGNMRGVLCEEPPNWRQWRQGCIPLLRIDSTEVYVWPVRALPADRLERLFNHDTIAPVLAGLKAQGEWEPVMTDTEQQNFIAAMPLQTFTPPTPTTKRRPLVVGDRVAGVSGWGEVMELGVFEAADGSTSNYVLVDRTWVDEAKCFLILPREGE